jgi:hypothetical protein
MKRYVFRYRGGPFPEPLPEVAQDASCVDNIIDELRGLFRERNNVYLSGFRKEGLPGVVGFIGHKLQRLRSRLAGEGEDDEDVIEHLLDLAIYAVLGVAILTDGERVQPCRHLFAPDSTAENRSITHFAVRCVLCGRAAVISNYVEPDEK